MHKAVFFAVIYNSENNRKWLGKLQSPYRMEYYIAVKNYTSDKF